MPALEGQFLKEISVRFAGENPLRTQKNTKQSSAQRFLNDPFPKTPFSAAEKSTGENSKNPMETAAQKLQISVPCRGRMRPDRVHAKGSYSAKGRVPAF